MYLKYLFYLYLSRNTYYISIMENAMQYQIIPERNLILEYYSGVIHKMDILNFKIEISKNVAYNHSYNIIHDFRDANFITDVNEIKSFIDHIKSNKRTYAQKKISFITDNPNQVSITYLFTLFKKETLLIADTFSTVEGAVVWVGLKPTETDYIKSLFEELKFDANS